MLRAYADEHVPHAIVRGLRARGMDVVSVTERDRRQAADDVLLEEAIAEQRMMLTCDADFLRLAARHHAAAAAFAPIVFWPQQQRAIGHVIRSVIRLATSLTYDEATSRVFFL